MKKTVHLQLLLLIIIIPLLNGCHTYNIQEESSLPQAPNYADTRMWDARESIGDSAAVDLFYVSPTCVWDWKDSAGNTFHYMDVYNERQQKAVSRANTLAYQVFGKSCRFYAPYYRQISMNSWFEPEDVIEERYKKAHVDVVKAFRYYMLHLNGNRPFILAGHSQGAKAVVELLKHTLTKEEYKRMVAAYVIGYSIDADEARNYPFLKPAQGPLDVGTTIAYNSVSKPQAMIFKKNVVCINPINWRTDGTYAPPEENRGSVFFHADGKADTLFHKVGARIDPTVHALLIDGLNPKDYYIPSIGKLFPLGSFHVQEFNLYFLNLQENLHKRIDAYLNSQVKATSTPNM